MKNRLSIVVAAATLCLSQIALAAPPASTPESVAKGQALFKTNCAICHGEKGLGDGPAGAALKPKARNFATEKLKFGSKPEEVFKTITEGSKGTSMAPFGHLPEADRWAITHFVLTLLPKK